MSLILDALRKSEAERRRGAAPSLYSSLPTPGTRRRPTALRHLPWIVLAVLLAVALFAFYRDDAPATDPQPAQAVDAGEESAAVSADTGFETAAAVVAASAPKPPAAVASSAAPAPAPRVDPTVNPPAAAAPAAAPAPASVALAPVAPTAPANEAEEQLPPVAILDTSTRAALPALKLSMHFYSAEPERRFAIIDGQRVVEGTQLGAGVVTQIRRDGVVLDVNGRRVLVPRP